MKRVIRIEIYSIWVEESQLLQHLVLLDLLFELLRRVEAWNWQVLKQHIKFIGHDAFARHFLHAKILNAHCATEPRAIFQYIIFEPGELFIDTILVKPFDLQEVDDIDFALVSGNQQQTSILLQDGDFGDLLRHHFVCDSNVLIQE